MDFNDQSIVLRIGQFRESDMYVRLLSPARGIFSAFAFGGCKSKKRFCGCLDIFNEVFFNIRHTGRGAYLALQEGVLVKGPRRLRTDWKRLGMAVNCSKFIESIGVTQDEAKSSHALFTQLLTFLEESETIPPLLPIFFRARLSQDLGLGLDVNTCSICRCSFKPNTSVLLPGGNNGLICTECAAKDKHLRVTYPYISTLSTDCFSVLRHIMLEPIDTWGNLPCSPYAQKECAGKVDSFLQYNTGLTWHKGRYCKV